MTDQILQTRVPRHDLFWRVAAIIMGTLSLGLTTAVMLMLFWPARGVYNMQVVMDAPTFRAGGLLSWKVSQCLDQGTFRYPNAIQVGREIEIQNHRASYALGHIDVLMTAPCETYVRAVPLPPVLPPGTYHLRVYTSVRINALRNFDQVFEGPAFQIVP